MLAFGPDGYLYVGTGDGGSGGDPQGNGQNLETVLGKILRIDVNSGEPYSSPPDNPFVGQPGRDEIWAYGLRNPWRFSFDRATGRLFAGDVGQNEFEEIDLIVRGGNYGWKIVEANACFSPPQDCDQSGLIPPIHVYGRNLGGSVTGGYVYRGQSAPSLTGRYVFADFVSGRMWALTEASPGQWQVELLLETPLLISSFGEDANGELYVVDYGGTVTLIVDSLTSGPAVNHGGIVNAASFLVGPVAPGMIITMFGTGLASGGGFAALLDSSGRVGNAIAGTQVLFDGAPAPLYFVRADQITAQVPYSVAGRTSSQVQVQSQGASTETVTVQVAESAPGVFAVNGGVGQGAILNENFSPNSPADPASRGSVVVIYATGAGQTDPGGEDGRLSAPPFEPPCFL